MLAIVAEDESRSEIAAGVEAIVVLDRTTMYAEMGGQVADHGVISADGVTFQVTDVQKNKGGKYMHTGKLTQGVLKVGGTVSASIDVKRRKARHAGPLRHPSAAKGAADGAGRPCPSGGFLRGA